MGSDAERARAEAASWLVLLDDDPDDQDRRVRFRAWLDAAPAHAAAWRSIARTGDLLAVAGREAATAIPNASPRTLLEQGRPGRGGRPARAFARGRYVAATALAACLVLAFAPLASLRWRADHVTGTARIETLRLDDGSTVRLGPDSAIRLAFSSGERRVELLSGEALFDVTADAARPFRVAARDATVTVLGTRFDVAMLGLGTSVAVGRGHVQVDSAAGVSSFDLRAGDWVRVNADGSAEKGADLPDFLTAGPDARVAARNRPVAEVIDRIRPWFGGRIVIADESVGRRPVTGVFDASDPARALEALVGPQGGRVIRVTPWLLIVSRG